ncbi:MAG: FtsW/RodA/SpoVE family cell cycle protein, partial [Bacteroidales bacterium]|nr:FtsW/RodA/SpoVE family cell cycle protein [Bacteroidales bacterium]
MSKLLRNIKGDKTIWLIVAILTVYSVLAVYSATGTLAFRYKGGNTEYFLFKHLGTVLLGLSLMYVAHLVKYTYYSRISQIALYIAVPLLVLTLFSGTNVNDAARWLTLPVINISFQTSDFAKLALIMFLARMLSKKQDNIKTFKEGFIPIVLPVLITCAFIIPANFSTAVILFASSLILLFVGRVKFQHLLALLLTGIVSVTIFIAVISMLPDGNRGRIDTWKQRIESFRTKDVAVNYQAEQSRIAIASGGIFGKFPGNSTQRDYLPQPFSDFIFSIIIEEYGLLGGIFIVLLYLI